MGAGEPSIFFIEPGEDLRGIVAEEDFDGQLHLFMGPGLFVPAGAESVHIYGGVGADGVRGGIFVDRGADGEIFKGDFQYGDRTAEGLGAGASVAAQKAAERSLGNT